MWLALAATVPCVVPVIASTQETPVAPAAAPRADSPAHASAAVETAVLGRPIALNLRRVSLKDALNAIASAADLQLTYSPQVVPLDRIVTITARQITAGDALRQALEGTGLAVFVTPGGLVSLESNRSRVTTAGVPVQPGTATISGYIRDSATGTAIPQVTVRIDGMRLETKSNADGRYQIGGLAAGEYRVTARRVGYIAVTRSVTIGDGQELTLSFLLNLPATRLNEVVTTALGEQRRYEVGNVIATINVDSLAPTAPVTSVTDLISARAPGVDIVENSGLVGGGEAIRIRGQSSLLVQSDPIIIVDGVRSDNAAGAPWSPIFQGVPSPNRLNDLDFTQIESISILKGPAAATEYGTDAASGVIVITTKRGTAGSALWHVGATQSASMVPSNFPETYYSWGHMTDGSAGATQCALVPLFGGLYSFAHEGSTRGTCVVDSVTHFNPLNHAATTLYGTGPGGRYDLDVSGGADAIRYYLAGGLSNSMGAIQVPPVFRREAAAIGFPASSLKPNSENQRSLRANTNVALSSKADAQVTLTYTSTAQLSPPTMELTGGVYDFGVPGNDSTNAYGYKSVYNSPLFLLGQSSSQQNDALTTGLTTNWRPFTWFVAHGTFGLQHASQTEQSQLTPQAQFVVSGTPNNGQTSAETDLQDIYTVDLRGAATFAPASQLKLTSSLGVQMVDRREQTLVASVTGNQSATNLTLNNAANPTVTQLYPRSATLGGYFEEEAALADRLFVTGALRLDAASGFGRSYSVSPYEKGSVSWLLVNTGPTRVRLRGAIGSAGVQPPDGAALQEYFLQPALYHGSTVAGYELSLAGTPGLQPERTLEYEGGADIGLWQNRLSVELTAYSKTTNNAIYQVPLGDEFNNLNQYENLGQVRNTGMEETVNATVLDGRVLSWVLALNASLNTNKLVHLAPGISTSWVGVGQRIAPGYPLYGYWANYVRYADVNHDGILESNEVSYDTAVSYLGSSLPREEVSLSTYLGFDHGIVTVGALWDYKTGYKLFNVTAQADGNSLSGRYSNDPTAPLWQQAQEFPAPMQSDQLISDGTFLRFRELNLTYALPRSWARSAHVASLSLTAAVRNLFIITPYIGDPESGGLAGNNDLDYQTSSRQLVLNNDYRADYGNVPLLRSWMVRLNLGL